MNRKNFYFLCGMPRAGNTLLGSIINQDSNISVTANSVMPAILYSLYQNKESLTFKNFPDHQSYDTLLSNLFNAYYFSWKASIIIDRGPWGLSSNLPLIKKYVNNNPKFIILYRPLVDCLASILKKEKPKDIQKCVDIYMDQKNGNVFKNLISIKNILKGKDPFICVHYDQLIKDTEKQLKKIYNFLELEMFNFNLKKISQFKANETYYDDSVLKGNFHQLRTDKIERIHFKIEDFLKSDMIKKYSKLEASLDLNIEKYI